MATSSQPCELSDTRIIKRREETCPGRAGAEDGTGHPVPTGHSALSEKGRLGEAGRSWARGRPPPWAPGRPQWEPGSLRVCGRAGGSRGQQGAPQGRRPLCAPWGNRTFPLGSFLVTPPGRSGSLCVLGGPKSIPEM